MIALAERAADLIAGRAPLVPVDPEAGGPGTGRDRRALAAPLLRLVAGGRAAP